LRNMSDCRGCFKSWLAAARKRFLARLAISNFCVKAVLGYTAPEIVGSSVGILVPDAQRKKHAGHLRRFFQQPDTRAMGSGLELYAKHKDGSHIPVEISLSPLQTPGGIFVSGSIRDVTEQKASTQKLLIANRAKNRFLAAASHDLKQPLQSLILRNREAKHRTEDSTLLQILNKQEKSLNWMDTLLYSLLEASALESDMVTPVIETVSVNTILETIGAIFEAAAKEKGLQFHVELEDLWIKTDPRLLTQVLENFTSNAIRYTSQGFVKIHSTVSGNTLRLAVSDSGIGIDDNDLDSIFLEYHQTSKEHESEGFGLGLSIVKQCGIALCCDVGVTSTVGEGSSFYIDVPLSDTRSKVQDTRQQLTTVENHGFILIIDDDPDIVDATAELLAVRGFTVVSASSLTMLQSRLAELETAPDLLIADAHLADLETGFEAIDIVRSAYDSDIPVILVSGDSACASNCCDLTNARFFSKPFDIYEFLGAVTEMSAKGTRVSPS